MAGTSTRTNLTKRKIDALPLPSSGQVIIRDRDLPGFALRATKGSKAFIVERRVKGRLHRVVIGPYGAWTVDGARDEAREILGKLARGESLASSRGELTFEKFSELYLERYAIRKKSYLHEKGRLKHLAHWNTWKLSAITRDDVAELHSKMGKTHPVGANRVLALLRTMLRLGVAWGYLKTSPATHIAMFPETSRDRFVQPDELPRLLTALKAETNPYVKSALLMCLLTGARRTEVLTAQWADIDLTAGNWRIPQTKSGHWHLLPLPGPLVQILSELPRVQDNPYVFVGRHEKGHLKNISRAWRSIRKEAGIPDVRIHDLRRTLGSWIAGTGVSLHVLGKILNHQQPSTTAIYSRLNLDPLREVLESNAQRMLTMGEKTDEEK
ncbi:MAG: site-specific integrase [Nitrospirales bacterium]|nr:site-specific integrase [Nitrospirales bacterium]